MPSAAQAPRVSNAALLSSKIHGPRAPVDRYGGTMNWLMSTHVSLFRLSRRVRRAVRCLPRRRGAARARGRGGLTGCCHGPARSRSRGLSRRGLSRRGGGPGLARGARRRGWTVPVAVARVARDPDPAGDLPFAADLSLPAGPAWPSALGVRRVLRRVGRAAAGSRWPTTSGAPSRAPATSAPQRTQAASARPLGWVSSPPHSGQGSGSGRSQVA